MNSSPLTRREWLGVVSPGLCTLALPATVLAATSSVHSEKSLLERRRYLESVMPTREQARAFITKELGPDGFSVNDGFTFDAELGWVATRNVRNNAINGSKWFADHEPDGARTCIAYAKDRCRIHTYGNSFTYGSQVNDGETWQEYLAAHFREPVRNYGIGGFSVYQAYRRMRVIEAVRPAEYILLNIYDDDHFRNLDAWRAIRWGRGSVGLTLPHVAVDVERDHFREVDNVIRRPEDIYKLCDAEFIWNTPHRRAPLGTLSRKRERAGVRAPQRLQLYLKR